MRDFILYRWWAEDGTLLYIGQSISVWNRVVAHRRGSEFFQDASTMTMERLPDKASLDAAEIDAIRSERPLWNKAHNNPGHTRTVVACKKAHEIEWTCAICGEAIRDRDGYLQVGVSGVELARIENAWRQHDAEKMQQRTVAGFSVTNLSTLLALPAEAPWQAVHRTCDDLGDASPYWFDIERARTPWQLLHWSGHLAQKSWIKHTNWDKLLQRVGTKIGGGP